MQRNRSRLLGNSAKVGRVSRRGETRGRRRSSWLTTRSERAVASGRVFPYIAVVMAIVAVGTGFIAHVIDPADFPSFGVGVWWAIVTIATVGYGDVVPHTAWGRVLGGFVILFGVTFISFLVAVVTALFVNAERANLEEAQASREDQRDALLRNMDARLASIEEQLGAPETSSVDQDLAEPAPPALEDRDRVPVDDSRTGE